MILSPELVSFMLDRRMGAPLKLGAENEEADGGGGAVGGESADR